MAPTPKSNRKAGITFYDTNYGNFQTELYSEIRREAFGEDIGQNSWMTASEQDMFLDWLHLSTEKKLLDIACGSGGPALRIAAKTGCSLVGIDLHEQAISTAKPRAAQRNLKNGAESRVANAREPLPFPDDHFEAITCVDAINHIPNRPTALAQWARLLKPGGRLLFTDSGGDRATDKRGTCHAQFCWPFAVCSRGLRQRSDCPVRPAVAREQESNDERG